jgi:tetratricopeptide (TPR) repeat protein
MRADLERSQTDNESAYEELVTVIEASKGTLALLIAVCDDLKLRDSIIEQYERDLKPTFQNYQLQLAKDEPSLRSVLGKWAEQKYQSTTSAMVTVTGAENLLWFKLRKDDLDRTEIEKFFGYLQWGREGLREFPCPIVLWVTQRILINLSLKAPDFWSWRKGVFRFTSDEAKKASALNNDRLILLKVLASDSSLLPLEDLQELIAATEKREGTEAPLLGTLYSRLAQVYQLRIGLKKAKDIQEERDLAIANYKKAIALQTTQKQYTALVNSLIDLGGFLFSQGTFQDMIPLFHQSLQISQNIGDPNGEANSLFALGLAYESLGQYPQAIGFYKQSLAIESEMEYRNGEASVLVALGNAYKMLGQYPQAIEYLEQSLAIKCEIGYSAVEALAWLNLGEIFIKVERVTDALGAYRNARQLYAEIGLEAEVQNCDNAIQQLSSSESQHHDRTY